MHTAEPDETEMTPVERFVHTSQRHTVVVTNEYAA
jgi:hypothetical protein